MKLKCNTCDGIYNTADIRFTKRCNNRCAFCIEKKSTIPGQITSVSKIMKGVRDSGVSEVLILGGEPFLEMKKLYHLVQQLRVASIKIYITTSLPPEITHDWGMFFAIMEKIDGLNVSIQSTDWKRNNEILDTDDSFNRLAALDTIATYFSVKTRVCLNLVKGGIDSEEKLFSALTTLAHYNVKRVKINELSHSDDYVSYEEIMGIRMKSPYAHGCYTRENITSLNMEVWVKRSCFITQDRLNASFADLIKVFIKRILPPVRNKFCVIYENGDMYKNWITGGQQ